MNRQFLGLVSLVLFAIPAGAQQQSSEPQLLNHQQSVDAKKSGLVEPLAEMSILSKDMPIQRLGDIKKIFISPLGTADGSELIRQKVISKLVKSTIITVVESPDDADAILSGAAEVRHQMYLYGSGSGLNGGTRTSASLVVHLTGKGKQIFWSDDIRSRILMPLNSSSNVADKLVKNLVEAIEADRNRIAQK
ncbi:MAG: hypothetical protein K2Y22_03590 [Candidatus Obscuribacterales bacterium]|nr:hypothetical protein [Candidatus Obscuribacterales bacterium]